MRENHYLVPFHRQGFRKDLEYKIVAGAAEEAEAMFVDAKNRLLDVNNWHKYGQGLNLIFTLTDAHGVEVIHPARKGDVMRMNVTEAGTAKPDQIKQMTIEAIEYDDYPDISMETFAMRVKAVVPVLDGQEGATATFVVERRGVKLVASYHGRNNENADAGIADAEWERLIKGFIEL